MYISDFELIEANRTFAQSMWADAFNGRRDIGEDFITSSSPEATKKLLFYKSFALRGVIDLGEYASALATRVIIVDPENDHCKIFKGEAKRDFFIGRQKVLNAFGEVLKELCNKEARVKDSFLKHVNEHIADVVRQEESHALKTDDVRALIKVVGQFDAKYQRGENVKIDFALLERPKPEVKSKSRRLPTKANG